MPKSAKTQAAPLILASVVACCLSACQPKEITSAKIYIQQSDWNRALEQLEIAVENNPDNTEAHFLLGKAYGYKGRFKDMNEAFARSLELSDKFHAEITAEKERHWIDKYHAGIKALDREEYENAEMYLKTAVIIDATKHEAHKRLALCYVNSGQVQNALFVYNRLLENYPSDVDLLMAVSNLFYSQKRFEETVAALKKVLALEPNHRDALANLALSYDSMGKEEEAETAFEKAVQANPLDADLIFLYGVHQYKRAHYERAIQLFQQVLGLKPNEFEATSNIGSAYLSMAEALRRQLKQGADGSMTPEEVQRLKNKIILNYKRAIPYLEQALDMQPNDPNLWRNLGVAYLNTDEEAKGEEAFLKSEQLRTNSIK